MDGVSCDTAGAGHGADRADAVAPVAEKEKLTAGAEDERGIIKAKRFARKERIDN